MRNRHLAFGMLFGFVLSRAGATDYNAIHGMFRLTDLHLVGLIGTAVALTALGFQLFRRAKIHTPAGQPVAIQAKPWSRGVLWGGLLFGTGWAIAGTCPGTALAQIGEGRLSGLITFGGIVLGAWLHGVWQRSKSRGAATAVRGRTGNGARAAATAA